MVKNFDRNHVEVKSLDSSAKRSLETFQMIHGNQGSLAIIFNKKEFTGHLSTIKFESIVSQN